MKSKAIAHQESELRRPGVQALAEKIALENPKWSALRVMTQAKLEYEKKQPRR